MSKESLYYAIARFPFDRVRGPWPQSRAEADRAQMHRQANEEQEAGLDEAKVFQWYRDKAKQKDPRRKRKGVAHPFGAVPVRLTASQARQFRREFQGVVDLLREQRVRLPKRSAFLQGSTKPAVGDGDLWHLDVTGARMAHEMGRRGAGVTVAVIDSGIDQTHPEFDRVMITSRRFDSITGADLGPSDGDALGHGTQMASLIAGERSGIAPQASLLEVKAFQTEHAEVNGVLAALQFVASHNEVRIVNVSLGFKRHEPALATVLNRLLSLDILPVCAVGNGGLVSPGDFDAVLTIGSVGRNGSLAADSASGDGVREDGTKFRIPDAVAPGEGVFCARAGGGVGEGNGTSHACAVASGLAALLIEGSPNLPVRDVMARMLLHRSPVVPAERAGVGLLQFAV